MHEYLQHCIILYNCNHERYCSGDFIEKNITPLTVDLLKYQRKDNYTLIVLKCNLFSILVIVVDVDPRSIKIRQSEIQHEKLLSVVVLMIFIWDPTSCICVVLLIL